MASERNDLIPFQVRLQTGKPIANLTAPAVPRIGERIVSKLAHGSVVARWEVVQVLYESDVEDDDAPCEIVVVVAQL